MVDLAVTHLLRGARAAGFSVELNDDKLSVQGPRDRRDILTDIRARKADIIEAIRHPGPAATHYINRLRNGIAWLDSCRAKLDAVENQAMSEAFGKNLHLWADLDEELRRVVPEFRGCPIDGCKEDAPVRCLHCASPTATKPQP
jgi:hypothetical protein